MVVLPYAVIAVSALGHAALWLGLFSRLHAVGWPRWQLEVVEKAILVALVAFPAWLLGSFAAGGVRSMADVHGLLQSGPLAAYIWLCFGLWGFVLLRWTWQTSRGRPRAFVHFQRRVIDSRSLAEEDPCGDRLAAAMAWIPGNQFLQLECNEKELLAPRLPAELDGLAIAHISDLHFTGRIRQSYFDLVVDQTNALRADLIAITGDIVDKPHCLPWIAETLGRLEAPCGVYCILGNHDLRVGDIASLVSGLRRAGLHYLGRRWATVALRGRELLLAGNELPWISPVSPLDDLPPRLAPGRAFRVLLSHSPDQISWARRHGFDLMLAGHTHGGQIRLPLAGALIGQSLYGVKYACGVFHESPTLMHVSRGVSGVEPLRINCRPEITRIVLRSPRAVVDGALESGLELGIAGAAIGGAVSSAACADGRH